jgi:outer membrane receptor protein involved in Fe transport
MRIAYLVSALFPHAARGALAAEGAVLPEVEVIGKRPSEAEERAPTAFVSEVDTTARDPAIETTADVLEEGVGVQVQRFGGLGAFSTISIRGSSANQVPVYLDGIPLSQALDQTVNLSDLPLDSLQQIDVYRGIVPVGFGGGGVGGVVNLITRPASAVPTTEISAGYGSFETRKLVASHTERVAGIDTLAHLTYLGSQGNFTYSDDNGTPENPTDDSTRTRINNAFDSVGLLLKGTRDVGGGMAVDGVEEFFFKDQGVPGPGTTQFADPSLEEIRSLTYARVRAPGLAHGAVDTTASAYGVYNLQAFADPKGNFGSVVHTHNQTMLLGINNSGTWFAPLGQAIEWFDELAYEEFFPYNATNEPDFPNAGPNQTRLRTTLALQDTLPLVSDRVLLVPSLRYDHDRDRFSGVNFVNIPDAPPETHTLDLFTPAVGTDVRLMPWLSIRANIGRYQRAPNFAELFGNAGSVQGNAALQPETGINRDAGFILTVGAHRWLDRLQLEYAYFYNNITDLIAFQQQSRTIFKAVNIGSARIDGSELAITGAAFSHVSLDFNYTHQDPTNLSGHSPYGNQLPLRSADALFLRPEVFNQWGKVFYEFTYLSSDPTDPANFIIVPSRAVHTVGTVLTPRPWLAIKFEAANIANADIRDLGDFPLPGLSFFGSITVTM